MEYREHDALIIDVARFSDRPTTTVFGNADGQDFAEYEDALNLALSESLRFTSKVTPTFPLYNTERVFAYTFKIPVWVEKGCEKEFVLDVYPNAEVRRRNRNEETRMYSYEFTVWGGK